MNLFHGTAVGDGIVSPHGRWTFGGDVCDTFDIHADKSIPYYRDGHELVAQLSEFFVRTGGVVYEIGCSTGTLIRALAQRHHGKDVRFLAVDVEPRMAEEARRRCARYPEIEIIEADATALKFEGFDFAAIYYTLQFLRPDQRQRLLAGLYSALLPGGAVVVYEKVRSASPMFQDLAQQIYQDFKLSNGYTPDEVLGKSRSLKGVLAPLTSEENIASLRAAGFGQVVSVQKYVCFEGFLAVK
ncbi:carboxy-S-adenosyl-L-methionine synthase [Acrocarpospora pleiomorpha]|uniref:Carboxy-S-adenosyl-L-methionine synthase n=1 Tax=Acrocarpospora pleiomorpha TaxID=90975 RepID=A0A5M3XQD7_9ACTN|nr:methyltransferase domain-containing protein [Acrocarpospora pleiomorpha]GES20498.1 carboxy-S-adenosyl-L-methionine synthase [Acrocarpospora pleiomorpha]